MGDVEGLKMLKAKGGSFAVASKSGTYPLHEAALSGKESECNLYDILQRGLQRGLQIKCDLKCKISFNPNQSS